MKKNPAKIKTVCIISATPLSIYFFLMPHILELSKKYDLTVIFDPNNDNYIGRLDLPAKITNIHMERKISPMQDLFSLVHLCRFFCINSYDLVISVAPKAGLLSMIAATFFSSALRVHIFQGEVWASKVGLLRWILKKADLITAFLADHVLAVSMAEKFFLVSEGIIPKNRIDVLGNGSIGGVNLDKFKFDGAARNEIRIELAIPTDATVALFIGRLVADKGISELVKAFAQNYQRCPNFFLMIVGPDEDGTLGKIFQGIEFCLDRVRLVGFTKRPEKYFSAADFLCLPSYREGFPVSILEAASIGIPAIGTNIYGIVDAIQDGVTGILCEPGDTSKLSEAMLILYINPTFRKSLGSSARVRVIDQYQESKVVLRYIDYFEQAMVKKSPRRSFFLVKRTVDFVLSLLGIFFLFIPMVFIASIIVLTSKGPAIYWSDRIGKNNVAFKMAKFRSMYIETPVLASDLLPDPQKCITKFGLFLRKTSLDELPQLWNILMGDMSFVGPRPALYNQIRLIKKRAELGVDSLPPGLTGLAQVNGRDQITDDQKLHLDFQYLQRASLCFDCKIFLMTFLRVFRSEGISH